MPTVIHNGLRITLLAFCFGLVIPNEGYPSNSSEQPQSDAPVAIDPRQLVAFDFDWMFDFTREFKFPLGNKFGAVVKVKGGMTFKLDTQKCDLLGDLDMGTALLTLCTPLLNPQVELQPPGPKPKIKRSKGKLRVGVSFKPTVSVGSASMGFSFSKKQPEDCCRYWTISVFLEAKLLGYTLSSEEYKVKDIDLQKYSRGNSIECNRPSAAAAQLSDCTKDKIDKGRCAFANDTECPKDTGGRCSWTKCATYRNAFCAKEGINKCECPVGKCAKLDSNRGQKVCVAGPPPPPHSPGCSGTVKPEVRLSNSPSVPRTNPPSVPRTNPSTTTVPKTIHPAHEEVSSAKWGAVPVMGLAAMGILL